MIAVAVANHAHEGFEFRVVEFENRGSVRDGHDEDVSDTALLAGDEHRHRAVAVEHRVSEVTVQDFAEHARRRLRNVERHARRLGGDDVPVQGHARVAGCGDGLVHGPHQAWAEPAL